MAKEIWINLPVKDVKRSKEFFTKIGFNLNPHYSNGDDSACVIVSEKNIAVMLFREDQFSHFTQTKISDTSNGCEVLISFDAASKEEVDSIAEKVESAGGVVYGKPSEIQGWMYGCGFIDPDGHRWNPLFMDMSKIPKT